MRSAWYILGKECEAFEQEFAAYGGSKHCIGVGNGLEALHLVLRAWGIGKGDEVIVPSNTYIASWLAVSYADATPVPVEPDPRTYNLDPARIEAAITPRTKAIMPVHLYGQIAPMAAIMDIARRHNLYVVEDAAQAHDAEYKGKRAGEWGDIACFSFYPGKNLGAYGDAGAICTNDDALADKIAKLRDHGRTSKYAHDEIGYGERLDSLQAAILGAKLPHLQAWTEARRRCAAYYTQALKGLQGIRTPVEMTDARHVYHIYCVSVAGDRDSILAELKNRGIETGIHYPIPLHLQTALAHHGGRAGDFPHTERAAKTILSLPIYPELTIEQMNRVVEELADVINAAQTA